MRVCLLCVFRINLISVILFKVDIKLKTIKMLHIKKSSPLKIEITFWFFIQITFCFSHVLKPVIQIDGFQLMTVQNKSEVTARLLKTRPGIFLIKSLKMQNTIYPVSKDTQWYDKLLSECNSFTLADNLSYKVKYISLHLHRYLSCCFFY